MIPIIWLCFGSDISWVCTINILEVHDQMHNYREQLKYKGPKQTNVRDTIVSIPTVNSTLMTQQECVPKFALPPYEHIMQKL